MSKKDLKVTLIGEDKTDKAFGSAGKGADGFAKAATAAFLAVGAAAVGVGVGLFKLGEEFDQAYDTIRVGTGATGDALGALKDDFRDVVKSVPTDFKSASTAIADLNTRTGQTGEPLRELSKQMLEMTRLTGGDLSSNIASVTRVFGDWGVAAGDQSGAMDYLFKVSQTTGIGIDSLSTKVVQFGAPLRQMGFDFETSAAMLGKWEKEGVNTEAVLSGMKIGLGKFSKAGKEPVEAMRSVAEAIKGAGSAGEANQIAIEAFGQRAGPDMAAAIREGRFDLDALMATLKGSKETILGAAADTADFGEKWQVLKNRVFVGLEPLATQVFEAVGSALDTFSAWWAVNGPVVMAMAEQVKAVLSGAFSAISSAVQSVAGFLNEHRSVAAAVFGALGALMVAWGVAATINAAKTVAAWAMMQAAAIKSAVVHAAQIGAMVVKWVFLGAQSLLHAAKVAAAWLIAMGPIGLVIAAVVGLVVVIVRNWDKIKEVIGAGWEWVRDKTTRAWDAVKAVVSGAVDAVKATVDRVFGAIKGLVDGYVTAWRSLIDAGWSAIKGLVEGYVKGVKAVIEAVWGGLKALVSGYVEGVKGAISGLSSIVQTVSGFFAGAKSAASGKLDELVGFVRGIPGRIVSALGSLGSLLVGAGGDLMRGLARGIGDAVGSVVRKAKDAAKAVVSAVKGAFGINSPSKVFAEIGSNLGDGMALGMDNSQRQVRASAQDMLDMAGMKVGGTGYINARLASTSGPVEGARLSPPSSNNDDVIALLERIDAHLVSLPRTVQAMDRQGVARG